MKELIKISDNNGNHTISAKELYIFLGYDASHWKRWYEKNIEKNEFAIENEDWEGFAIMASSNNGIPTKDFALTIDFAKKLAMMARTEKGEQARQYFIEVEKQYKGQIAHQQQPMSIEEIMIKQLQDSIAQRKRVDEIEQKQSTIEQKQSELAAEVAEIKANKNTEPAVDTNYYSVKGWFKLYSKRFDINEARSVGIKCRKISLERNIEIGKTYSAEFGEVNTYHRSILSEVTGMADYSVSQIEVPTPMPATYNGKSIDLQEISNKIGYLKIVHGITHNTIAERVGVNRCIISRIFGLQRYADKYLIYKFEAAFKKELTGYADYMKAISSVVPYPVVKPKIKRTSKNIIVYQFA
jgi:anti-repressor protein